MLDRAAQRLAQLALGHVNHRPQYGIGHVPAGGGSDAQHALGLAVQLRDPLEQQVTQDERQVLATLAGGRQQLLGKERIALRADEDRLGQRWREPLRAAVQQ